jgi:hypothetical protein
MKTHRTLHIGLLAGLSGLGLTAQAQLFVFVDPSTALLQPGQPDQVVRLTLENQGADVPVLGGTFAFLIHQGDSFANGPGISQVRLLDGPGSPFTSSSAIQWDGVQEVPQLRTVDFATLPLFTPTQVILAAGSSFTFAELVLDTTGIAPGQTFTVGTQGEYAAGGDIVYFFESYFDEVSPINPLDIVERMPVYGNMTFTVVPEPEWGALIMGAALMGIAWFHRRSRRSSRSV